MTPIRERCSRPLSLDPVGIAAEGEKQGESPPGETERLVCPSQAPHPPGHACSPMEEAPIPLSRRLSALPGTSETPLQGLRMLLLPGLLENGRLVSETRTSGVHFKRYYSLCIRNGPPGCGSEIKKQNIKMRINQLTCE